eukprot:CAMPEP_0194330750 /NCGR_PEP_ID=MMETSP0171-20130528/53092_1 /TAXON_ID=218684 /ORGANISM="Corethron pennatum, Strain L29A3" /LENGTH=55 /DNA_ID=CAMNT_0039091929 /DNA_START=208 /DNA_END=372 /DNA_ORIENTATION=+
MCDDDFGLPCEEPGLRQMIEDNKAVAFGGIVLVGALVYVVFFMEDRSAEGGSVLD